MVALNMKYLEELEEYMKSGNMAEDFSFCGLDRRYEMLEFLEKFMDVAELADSVATEVIFKDSQLGKLTGGVPAGVQDPKAQK